MSDKKRKFLVKIMAIVLAALMTVGTAYYLFAIFG
jgi:hypothetical protein